MSAFSALLIEKNDDGFRRSIVERHVDDLPAGDLLIDVHYSSLNYKDGLSATGNPGVTRKFPHTPGIDAAGTVLASDSPDFAVGDEVIVIGFDLGMSTPGGFGQRIRVPAGWAVPRPDGLSLRESMILGTAGFTAAECVDKLERMGGLTPDHGPVLVTGATGGTVRRRAETPSTSPMPRAICRARRATDPPRL
jgi:alcohol dehydrogenase